MQSEDIPSKNLLQNCFYADLSFAQIHYIMPRDIQYFSPSKSPIFEVLHMSSREEGLPHPACWVTNPVSQCLFFPESLVLGEGFTTRRVRMGLPVIAYYFES